MDRDTEIRLIDEVLGLRKAQSAYVEADVATSPVTRYTCPDRFAAERAAIFRRQPILLAHSSELAGEGDFLRRDLAGLPVLLTRDRAGAVHAFLNVCRHRGARLVEAASGCRHRFTCPYHAWTWDNTGRLIAAPHREQGFPDLDFEAHGLARLACAERFGCIWVQAEGEMDIDGCLAPLADDLSALALDAHQVHAADARTWATNWKIVVEGGLEAYHFRVAHADTIAPYFHDNLSTWAAFGPHIRSVLARTSIDDLAGQPSGDWVLRDHANLLYTLFPSTALLVQQDHVVMIQFDAISPADTRIRCVTLRPNDSARPSEHWDRNHAFTVKTLAEDFTLGESQQAGFETGANTHLTFGRYEGALAAFNDIVDAAL